MKMKRTSIVFLLALLWSTSSLVSASDENVVFEPSLFDALEYRMVGPFRGGRSTAVTGIVQQPHTYFMGATGGGVWRTTNAGNSWVNISDGFFEVGAIGSIDVADSDPNVIYVGTGSSCTRGNISTGRGVYKSTDGGKTWVFSGLREAGQIGRIEIHPTNPDLVYLAALGHPFGPNPERGIYRSADGGENWEKVLFVNDETGAADLSMNPGNPREIYAGIWRAERKPWSMISGGPEGGVYKTTDGGNTWKKLSGGLPSDMVGRVGVAVSPANPKRVWTILEAEPEGGVYRSDDSGETWTRVNHENKLRQRAWYYTHITADPKDADTVYALNTSLYRSVDGGRTFERISVPHGDVHDLWINPHDPTLMVVADDGGAQVSLDAGKSWSTYYNQPTAELYDVVVDNAFPYRLYGAQQDNTTISVTSWASTNTLHPKQHWTSVGGCETGPVALHPDHPELVYAGCYGGVIDRFEREEDQIRNMVIYPQLQLGNAGENMKYRFQWVAPIAVSPHDPDVVYHGSQYVHRSNDRGMNWETISPDLTTNDPEHQDFSGGPINHDITGVEMFNTIFALVVSPHSPDVIWAGSDDGRIHITRDGGANWKEITPTDMPELGTVDEIDVSLHQPGRAFVSVHRYRLDDFAPYVFRTNNYGSSWERITTGANGIPNDFPVRVMREDPEHEGLLYAGTEFGTFISFNDGKNWQSLQLNLPVTPVTGMQVAHDDLILSTQGRSFWILDDVTPLRELSETVAQSEMHLYSPRDAVRANTGARSGIDENDEEEGGITPDPPPGKALIHFHLAAVPEDEVTLTILDRGGNVVRRFTSSEERAKEEKIGKMKIRAGLNRVVWDLTYPGPDKPEDVVLWGYGGGVKAPPGPYEIQFDALGQSQKRTMLVMRDPRLNAVMQEDYEEQLALALSIRDTMNDLYGSIRQVRSIREQLDTFAERAKRAGFGEGIQAAVTELEDKLDSIEEVMVQTKNQSGQDPIRFAPRLENQFVALYEYVTGPDEYRSGGPEGKPTAGAYARFDDLKAEWNEAKTRLQKILNEDLAQFNQTLKDQQVPPIITR
jgi:photosystem II stability/assembly factor-like uncharacterized protein